MNDLLRAIATPEKTNIPDLRIGDSVSVSLRIKEGENERVQEFKGIVIRQKRGTTPTFTVRRIASNGIGVERTFLTNSPRIERVKVQRHAHTRRAKLYYMRERSGKRAKLKQSFKK
jgi:large subunit ribosomal protein L19